MEGVRAVTVYGYTPFTTYNCSVKALNQAGQGGPSASVTAKTVDECKFP